MCGQQTKLSYIHYLDMVGLHLSYKYGLVCGHTRDVYGMKNWRTVVLLLQFVTVSRGISNEYEGGEKIEQE